MTESSGMGRQLDEIKQFYDEVYYADLDAENPGLIRHYRRLRERLAIRAGSRLLDVACGTGEWLSTCQEIGAEVAGVDLSEKAIDVCRKLMPEGRFFAQPAETLPFEDREFDVITCLGSLEHFVDPVSSIREMVRVAAPGASFVFLVPNADFLTRKLGLYGGTRQTAAREVVRTIDQWETLFESAGVRVNSSWKDLHTVNLRWVVDGPAYRWPIRAMQSLMLILWPLRWQYQVYFHGHAAIPAEPV